jgi:hypothetical protein
MSLEMFRALGWGLSAVAVLLLAWGASLARRQWQRTRGWRMAEGIVVDQAVHALTPGNPYHFPIVEFVADNGRSCRFESSTGRYVHPIPVGTRVDVLYDPERPETALIDRFADRWFAAAGIAGLGLLALVIGLMFVALAR